MTAGTEEPYWERAFDMAAPLVPTRCFSMFGYYFYAPLGLRNLPGAIGFYCGLTGLIWSFVPVIGFVVALPVALTAVGFGLAGYVGADWLVATNSRRALLGAIFGLVTFVLVGFGGGRYW